jgi:hypothetical protein
MSAQPIQHLAERQGYTIVRWYSDDKLWGAEGRTMIADSKSGQEYPMRGDTKADALERRALMDDWYEPTPEQKREMVNRLTRIATDPETKPRDVTRAVTLLAKLTETKVTVGLKINETIELDERLSVLESQRRF